MTTSDHKAPTILSNLTNISEQGVALYLNGKASTPDEIAACCVNDEMLYMPDYVIDDKGAVTEVRYDKVVFR